MHGKIGSYWMLELWYTDLKCSSRNFIKLKKQTVEQCKFDTICVKKKIFFFKKLLVSA